MAGPQGFRQRSHPRSQEAQINRFKTQVRQDPNFIYQSHSPAGNQYDMRDFSTYTGQSTKGIGRHRQVNDGPIDFKQMAFENSYFTNPITGQKFGKSMAEGPGGWLESRHIYPDASGYGSSYDEEGNYSEYPIQLKGPQTWNYDPGNSGIMGLEMADASDYIDKMKEGYQKIEPYLPDVDWQDKSIGYEYNKPLWGGNLGIGGEYDVDDDEYNVGINWTTG